MSITPYQPVPRPKINAAVLFLPATRLAFTSSGFAMPLSALQPELAVLYAN